MNESYESITDRGYRKKREKERRKDTGVARLASELNKQLRKERVKKE